MATGDLLVVGAATKVGTKLEGARQRQQPAIFRLRYWRNEELVPIWGLPNRSEAVTVTSEYGF